MEFSFLPNDWKVLIFTFLDRKALYSSLFVCLEWSRLINKNEVIFEAMCRKLWNTKLPNDINWKTVYTNIVSKHEKSIAGSNAWTDVECLASKWIKISVTDTDYIYSKGIEKFNCSELVGNYAK